MPNWNNEDGSLIKNKKAGRDWISEYENLFPKAIKSHIVIYSKSPNVVSTTSLPYSVLLDTGIEQIHPLMVKWVFFELRILNIIKSDQQLFPSRAVAVGIEKNLVNLEDLTLEDPVTFWTEAGSPIKISRFYVMDKRFDHFNVGKHTTADLGIEWNLNDDFVSLGIM